MLSVICLVSLAFGVCSTALAVEDKALYNENTAQIAGYVADDYYSVKANGYIAECKEEATVAKNNLKKHSCLAGCMYFVALATGGSLIFITIKSRKEAHNV